MSGDIAWHGDSVNQISPAFGTLKGYVLQMQEASTHEPAFTDGEPIFGDEMTEQALAMFGPTGQTTLLINKYIYGMGLAVGMPEEQLGFVGAGQDATESDATQSGDFMGNGGKY